MSKLPYWPSILLVAVPAAGCGYKPKALPVRVMAEYPNAVRHHEVSLAAEPFNETTSREILDQPVNRKGYVPVLVHARNDGENRAIIDGGRVRLMDGQGRQIDRVDCQAVAKKCEKSVALHVILFGWISGFGASEYNTKMTEDWKSKEFPLQVVLEPHSSAHGLIFYESGEEADVHGGRLLVPVALGTDKAYKDVGNRSAVCNVR